MPALKVAVRDDHALLERTRAGDETAFADLVARHHTRLAQLSAALVANCENAEDVVQETWSQMLEELPTFDGRTAFKMWIICILIKQARARGAFGVERGTPSVDAIRFHPDGGWARPPRRGRRTTTTVLLRALSTLPAAERAMVMLRDVEGLSSREICDVLELGQAQVHVLLHRGRTRLLEALEMARLDGWDSGARSARAHEHGSNR